MHGLAVQLDLALVGDLRAGEALDERRLAGTVVADDREDFSGVQIEADAVESHDVSVGLDEALRRQHRRARLGGRVAHQRTFRIHWSMETATITRMPTAKVW